MENMYNFWVGCSTVFKDELVGKLFTDPSETAVSFPLLNGLTDDTVATLQGVHDHGTVQQLFKEYDSGVKIYKVWSFYASKPDNVNDVKADFDALELAYPQDFVIMGAWKCSDGTQLAAYSPDPLLLNFMPDVVVDNTDPDNPVFGAATVLTDVNLLAGQAPRDFS